MRIKLLAILLSLSAFSNDLVLDTIKATNQVRVGVRASSSPFSYKLPTGEYVGFAVDLCKAVVDNLKKDYPTLNAQYLEVTSENRIDMIRNHQIDMECGSTTNNAIRRKDVSFSMPYYFSSITVVSNKEDNIRSFEDLKNNDSVVFTKGTTTSKQIITENPRSVVIFNARHITIIQGKDHKDSFNLLMTGKAKIFANDDVLIKSLIANSGNPDSFYIFPKKYSLEPYSIMYAKDSKMGEVINNSISSLMATGEFTKLYNKWFLEPIPPANNVLNIPMHNLIHDLIRSPTPVIGN